MNITKNADIASLVVTSIEDKPVTGSLILKPLIRGDQMTLLELHYTPGTSAPIHVHAHESLVYVVRGRVKTTVAGEVYELGAGDVGCHPQGVPHTVEAIEESVVIEIKSPAPEIAQFLGTHKGS
jgi:quercetin dioxygenase-like cupin family protein